MKIWIVDAFTDKPFEGNPAAITIIDEFLSDEMCKKIAAEMNLSETAFLKPMGPDHFHIRWFTPLTEVELCGHGTLAAAHILFQEKMVKDNKISFDSLYGPLYVNREGSSVCLDFPLIKMENNPFPLLPLKNLLELKSLTAAFHSHNTVIAELSDEDELRSLNLDPEKVKQIEHNTVIITTRGKTPYDFVSRVYAPREGINEDPVTGSAHCLLVDYWQKKLGKSQFLAYQASLRGGTLDLQMVGDRVHLRGQAVTILEGTLKV